jgi:protein arginine N-methyltransferase 1
LDIGCGTGILSIFASRAGAKHVYGIEFADIADYAREIVKVNKLTDKVTIIKSKVEEAVLPVDKVDIIISEWMGYFLIYESMLDTVLYARDKWLKKDGYILPDKASLTVAAMEDGNYKSSKLQFWDDVYGINMKCVKPAVMSEPLIDICERQAINSSHCKIMEIDLYTVKKEDLDFTAAYELTFFRSDTLHGIISWFDIYFDKLPNKVEFTTSPYSKATHWKQVVFYTDHDLYVEKGEVLKGSIAVKKSNFNFREIDVKLSFHFSGRNDKKDWYQLFKIR